MTKARRSRTGSIQSDIAAHQTASKVVAWPTGVVTPFSEPARQARAQAVFDSIIAARSHEDWRLIDVLAAARLALLQILLDETDTELAATGMLVLGGKTGTTEITNPRLNASQMLQTRAVTLSRQLSQFGLASEKRELTRRANAATEAKRVITRASDPLLAGFDGHDLLA